MTIRLPDGIEHLKWIVGFEFPQADEDALWRCAVAWRSAAADLRRLPPEAFVVGERVTGALGGDAGAAFTAVWQPFTGGDGLVERLANVCDELGSACDRVATEVEYAKLAFIAALVVLAGTLAALTAALVAGGISALGMPAAIAGAQLAIRTILLRLVLAMAIGAAINAALDAVVQSLQIIEGHRHGWDLGLTQRSAEDGALYGAIGAAGLLGGARLLPGLVKSPWGVFGTLGASGAVGGIAVPLVRGEAISGSALMAAAVAGGVAASGPGLVHGHAHDGEAGGPSALDVREPGRVYEFVDFQADSDELVLTGHKQDELGGGGIALEPDPHLGRRVEPSAVPSTLEPAAVAETPVLSRELPRPDAAPAAPKPWDAPPAPTQEAPREARGVAPSAAANHPPVSASTASPSSPVQARPAPSTVPSTVLPSTGAASFGAPSAGAPSSVASSRGVPPSGGPITASATASSPATVADAGPAVGFGPGAVVVPSHHAEADGAVSAQGAVAQPAHPAGPLSDAAAVDLVRRTVLDTDAGFAFYPLGDDVLDFAQAVPATPGYVTLDLHGTRTGFLIDGASLTPEQFAAGLRESAAVGLLELPAGLGVKLISCDTAFGGSASPAAALARELGVEVIAPDQPVWTSMLGEEIVSSPTIVNGVIVPSDPPDGHWHRFDRTGAEVPFSDGLRDARS